MTPELATSDPANLAQKARDPELREPLLRQSLVESFTWTALAMACVGALYLIVCLVIHGFEAFVVAIHVDKGLALTGLGHELATAAVAVVLPAVYYAYRRGRTGDLRGGGFWLSLALFALILLIVVPRGIHSPGWYLQPLLTILVAVTFGVVPGLVMALIGAATLILTAWAQKAELLAAPVMVHGVWHTALAVAAVILVTGLLGSIAHKVVNTSIEVEVAQRQRLSDVLAMLRRRDRLLRHAMRIETIGGMAGLIVHQLRNQMQKIVGHAALGTSGDVASKQQALERITGAVTESTGLFRQLLNLAHPAEGDVKLVDLGDIAVAFVEEARSLLPKGIEVESEIVAKKFPCRLDAAEVSQSLWNLALNSKQAISGNGRVRVRLQLEGRYAALSVSDNGQGIEPEHLPLIFKPFFTTKAKGIGTGLGLAAVYRCVQTAGGTVKAESVVGTGTTITMYFPLVPPELVTSLRSPREVSV